MNADVLSPLSRSIFEGSNDCIKIVDLDGRLSYMNGPGMCVMEIDDFKPLRGAVWEEFWPEDVRAKLRNAFHDALIGKVGHFSGYCPTAKGTRKFWDVRLSPVFDDKGNVVSVCAISRDITQYMEMIEQLEETDRRKNEFLAMFAHELRNPLSPLLGLISLIHDDSLSPEEREQFCQMMEGQIDHIVRMVDDLSDVSRINRGMLEVESNPVNLAEVLNMAEENARSRIEKSQTRFVIDCKTNGVQVPGDQTRLVQVVTNLLGNATKFTPPGGEIKLSSWTDGQHAFIAVQDTGEGIAEENLDKIFGQFFQVKKSSRENPQGMGIGLSLVHQLVTQHNGSVTASSPGLGQGATFTVRLPVYVA